MTFNIVNLTGTYPYLVTLNFLYFPYHSVRYCVITFWTPGPGYLNLKSEPATDKFHPLYLIVLSSGSDFDSAYPIGGWDKNARKQCTIHGSISLILG